MNTTFKEPFITALLDHITDAVLVFDRIRKELIYWNRPAGIILDHAGYSLQNKDSIRTFINDRLGFVFFEGETGTFPLNGFLILNQKGNRFPRLFEYCIDRNEPEIPSAAANTNCGGSSLSGSGRSFSDSGRNSADLFFIILKPQLLVEYTDKYPKELIGPSFLELLRSEQGGDSLTGLPDRNIFRRYWQTLYDNPTRTEMNNGVLLFCDLLHFKQINDQQGHQTGDDILIQAARLLEKIFSFPDLPARYGGDEFLVLCPHSSRKQAEDKFHLYQKSLRQLSLDCRLPEGTIQMEYGLTDCKPDSSLADLVRLADNDYYRKKNKESNSPCF